MRAGTLPSTDPAELAKETEIVPQLLAHAGGLQRAIAPVAGKLAAASMGMWPQIRERAVPAADRARAIWRRIPPARRVPVAIAGVVLAALVAWLLGRGDAVERAVDRGDFRKARTLLQAMPAGAAKAFDEGRLDEARGSLPRMRRNPSPAHRHWSVPGGTISVLDGTSSE